MSSKLIGLLLMLTLAFTAGWRVCAWREASRLYTASEKTMAVAKKVEIRHEQTETHYDRAVARYAKQEKKDSEYVTKEIITVPVYRDCIVPVDGVRLLDSAIDSANQALATFGAPAPL